MRVNEVKQRTASSPCCSDATHPLEGVTVPKRYRHICQPTSPPVPPPTKRMDRAGNQSYLSIYDSAPSEPMRDRYKMSLTTGAGLEDDGHVLL